MTPASSSSSPKVESAELTHLLPGPSSSCAHRQHLPLLPRSKVGNRIKRPEVGKAFAHLGFFFFFLFTDGTQTHPQSRWPTKTQQPVFGFHVSSFDWHLLSCADTSAIVSTTQYDSNREMCLEHGTQKDDGVGQTG